MAPDREHGEQPPIKITDKRWKRDDATSTPADEVGVEGSSPGGIDASADDDASALETAREEAAQYLDHLRRLQAEFDNYRKRVLKEQTDAVERAAVPAVQRLLEVLDDFDLALMSATEKPDSTGSCTASNWSTRSSPTR